MNEAARLAALQEYGILDTDGEPAFDALARLAAFVFETPVALVSLVDADRQWFKARIGIDVTETPRNVSFCAHVVAEGAPLVVCDTNADERFADNPVTTSEPRVRFYAGMPLRTPDGHVLGTLCVMGRSPKQPTPTQLAMLALLADQVVDQLEARRKTRQLVAERAAAVESARCFQVLFDAMAEGVVVQGADGEVIASNGAAERILGATAAELTGQARLDPRWKSVREDGSPFPGDAYPPTVALRTGRASSDVVMGVYKAGGEVTWINVNALPLRHDGAVQPYGVVTTFHDITMIKGAQAAAERLARQEHLVTTGTLASGIGHEINNPLTSTLANIEVALEELTSMAKTDGSGRLLEIAAIMEQAREGAERVRQIVRGLRALARQEDVAMPTDVAAAIESSLRVAAHELRHKATVILDLAQTPPVLTGESRLSQVLVNLLINAAQSFLTADILQNRITVSTRVDGAGRVAIAVSDNGPGIPAHLRSRIFDPFFTTKPVGQGTGLGLSVAQSVVASVGGEISVESTLGCGATFRVLLPAVMPLQPSAPGVQPLARGRVLVVDDEAAVLSAIRRVLEKQHDVVLVSDAREALVRLESGERFDVIFCDLMMPWLGGDQLYMKVRAYDLRLAERFVFITGGVTEGRIQRFLAQVPNERLEKPLSIHNVRGIVRRFVDSSASSPALEGLAKPTRASVPPPSQAPAGL